MTAALKPCVGEFAGALGQVYHTIRLYPEGHPLRQQHCAHLLALWTTLAEDFPQLRIDFAGQRILPEGGPSERCTSQAFQELAHHVVEAGLSTCTLRGPAGGSRVLGLISNLAAGRPVENDESPPVTEQAPVSDAPDLNPSETTDPPAHALLRKVWSSLVRERRFDAETLNKVVDSVSSMSGDGIVEPVLLDWSTNFQIQLLAHALNMARLVYLSARISGLRSSELHLAVEATLLSDIGMLEVPEHLLSSQERLRPAEFRVIRRHPLDGARILLATPGAPLLAAVLAFEHHRRCQGRGYPQVARNVPSIPIAQLVQVADIYAALRTPRPFRNAVPEVAARAVLAKQKGDTLDPEAVDLVLDRAAPAGITVGREVHRGAESVATPDPLQ